MRELLTRDLLESEHLRKLYRQLQRRLRYQVNYLSLSMKCLDISSQEHLEYSLKENKKPSKRLDMLALVEDMTNIPDGQHLKVSCEQKSKVANGRRNVSLYK